MLKIMKYVRPFIAPLLIAIALLFVQAIAELTLPDYMSDIVNKGILQGGIDNPVPDILLESDMNRLILFWDTSNKEAIMSKYELLRSDNERYKEIKNKYPNINNNPIYKLKELTKKDIEFIKLPMARALLAVSGISQIYSTAENGFIDFNGIKIPADTDIFALISQIPDNAKEQLLKQATDRFEEMGDMMVLQAGANIVKSYYEALGLNTKQLQRSYIIRIGIVMLVLTLISAASNILVGYIASRVSAGLGRDLRKKVFSKVSSFTNITMDKFSTASLITRSTNDITQVQVLMVMVIRLMFYAPIMGLGGVSKALSRSRSMSGIIAVAVLILLGAIAIIFSIALPKFKKVQKLLDKLNMVIRENLSGIMVIRAFNTQSFQEKRFDETSKDLTSTNLFVNRVISVLMPFMMLVMNGTMVLIVWIGAKQIENSQMMVGDMMAFMQYAMQIIMSFLMLSMMFILIPRASVSARRINEVLDTAPAILDPDIPKKLSKKPKGILEFKNVTFKYEGAEKEMLKDITFKAEPGKVTAIIGATGSGKSTLVNLIPRFYDVTGGEVTIDGIDVRKLRQHDVREVIGFVPQKSTLFSGTIASNLRFGDEAAGDDDLIEAATIAQAIDFIKQKDEGFSSPIAQGGTNVSGGQKQRLSIARALVKKPPIYVFDDSFSALDFKTDAALRKALSKTTEDKTIIIVAQRISTIKHADQILVLHEGNMVGLGTHDELMKECVEYQEIAYSQLSKEELA